MDFRKPTELASYSHVLSEVNLIQGVYIQNVLKTSSIWTYLPFFIFESGGEELHNMGVNIPASDGSVSAAGK